MKYYVEDPKGATVSIVVPWDCPYNCPFCVTKEEYTDMTGFSIYKIFESIKCMDKISPECDFVITGGEPFARMDWLNSMLEYISSLGNNHKVYINTTLPSLHDKYNEYINFIMEWRYLISGINVSRHLKPYTTDNCFEKKRERTDLLALKMIKQIIPVRINCTLYDEDSITVDDLMKHMEIYKGFGVQYRRDYVKTTLDDVRDISISNMWDKIRNANRKLGKFGMKFEFQNANRSNMALPSAHYHVTLPYSHIVVDNKDVLVDVIINQKGEIMDDWNGYGKPLDLDAYENREVLF